MRVVIALMCLTLAGCAEPNPGLQRWALMRAQQPLQPLPQQPIYAGGGPTVVTGPNGQMTTCYQGAGRTINCY